MAYAASGTISGSAHDLSGHSTGVTGTDEICVYCHTPHNPMVAVPLWNRKDGSTQTLYNSPTLTSEARTASYSLQSISAFCMSCHDGVTKMGAIKNRPVPGTLGGDDTTNDFGTTITGGGYAAIGLDGGSSLTNDHPIGFSYSVAQSQDQSESGTGGLKSIASVKSPYRLDLNGAYSPFYKNPGRTTNNDNQMECASCHAVHQPGDSKNFLRIENNKSALCLACHNK